MSAHEIGNSAPIGSTWEIVVTDDLTRTRLVQYAGASGDFNPLHTDDVYAREVAGAPGVFAHGMLSMGLLGDAVTRVVGSGKLTKYGVRFRDRVWPGDRLIAHIRLADVSVLDGETFCDYELSLRNQNGLDVVTGYAQARRPTTTS